MKNETVFGILAQDLKHGVSFMRIEEIHTNGWRPVYEYLIKTEIFGLIYAYVKNVHSECYHRRLTFERKSSKLVSYQKYYTICLLNYHLITKLNHDFNRTSFTKLLRNCKSTTTQKIKIGDIFQVLFYFEYGFEKQANKAYLVTFFWVKLIFLCSSM